MALFHWGDIQLHSGGTSWWHIDCDALSDAEIRLFAKLISLRVGDFDYVTCPQSHPGSAAPKLVEALRPFSFSGTSTIVLCVDDVLSTGGSLEDLRAIQEHNGLTVKGAVIFARGPCPSWVKPIFSMPEV